MTVKESVLQTLRKLKDPDTSSDIAADRDEWVQAVDDLFKQFKKWLSDAVKEKLLTIHMTKSHVESDILGTFSVPMMVIRAPSGAEIVIDPKNRFAAGTKGRVDIQRLPKVRNLVRTPENKWAFAELNPPHGWSLRPLTEETFWATIADLIGAREIA